MSKTKVAVAIEQVSVDNNDAEIKQLERDALIAQRNATILSNYKAVANAAVNNKMLKSRATANELNISIAQYIHYELMTCNTLKIQSYIDNVCKKLQCDKFNFDRTTIININNAVCYIKSKIIVKQALNELKARQAIERAVTRCTTDVVQELNALYGTGVVKKWTDAATNNATFLVKTLEDFVSCNIEIDNE